ncbi:hypothetical protein KXV85_002287, partial [Aspergillus fumigatus]
LRLFGGTWQFRRQHPDRRQQRQRCPRGRALFGVRLPGRRDRQQRGRRRRARRLRLQFQRGRAYRGCPGQHHPQPRSEAADRHRAGRRCRRRHLCRGGFLGDRERHRERAVLRHRRRLGQISARRRDIGQCDPQGARRRRRVRRTGRGHRARQQQHDLGDTARRRGRARPCAGGDVGPFGRRRAAFCAARRGRERRAA